MHDLLGGEGLFPWIRMFWAGFVADSWLNNIFECLDGGK